MTEGMKPLPPRVDQPGTWVAAAGAALLRRGPGLGVLLLCLAGGALVSRLIGTDRNWDLRNYHLYAPFALLHGRMLFDIAPAQVQSFFNPYLYLPHHWLYWAMQDRPRGFALVMGLPAGAFGFLMLRIAWDHVTQVLPAGPAAWAAVLIFGAMGLSGAAVLPAVGLSNFDIAAALPIAGAYLLVLRAVVAGRGRSRPAGLLLAGALAGLAAGLKLTTAPFAAAIGLMVLALLGLRAAIVAGAGMAAGFLLGFGPFAWQLWQAFGNPMFPHYNQIFRSPDWLPQHFFDARFLPRSTLQAIFYPWWFLWTSSGVVTEFEMRDPRMALGYVAWFVVLGLLLLRWPRPAALRPTLLALGVAALGYIAWTRMFGIYRYLVLLEALGVVLVMLAFVMPRPARPWPGLAGFAAVALFAIGFTVHPNWGHGPHGKRLIEVTPLPVQPGALVVMVGDAPLAYLVPLLPPNVRVLGLANNLIRPDQETGLTRRITAALAAHSGPIWSITEGGTTAAERDRALAAFGLAVDGACIPVRSSLEPAGHQFCPIGRRS